MDFLKLWTTATRFPGGKWLFSRAIGLVAPYSASIRPNVVELRRGYCAVEMRERRAVRNPFRSVHAAALFNFGELATGLAFLTVLPEDMRGIPVRLEIDYLKKARGKLRCSCSCGAPEPGSETARLVGEIVDDANESVAKIVAIWAVERKPT